MEVTGLHVGQLSKLVVRVQPLGKRPLWHLDAITVSTCKYLVASFPLLQKDAPLHSSRCAFCVEGAGASGLHLSADCQSLLRFKDPLTAGHLPG
jgi:hypothetical protein